ncbi:MAG: DUF2268 domain-containing putative Zn-dependent protease [Acidobacteriota bacterium]
MLSFKKTLVLLAALLLFAVSTTAAPRSDDSSSQEHFDALFDGHKIVNVVDDFLNFWEQARGKKMSRQYKLWKRLVESKHQEYFDRAIYQNATPPERLVMLHQFLIRVPSRINRLREFNKIAEEELRIAIYNFKSRFPFYHQRQDIFIGLSFFLFDGSVRPVGNENGVPDTLCLGAEVLTEYNIEQLQIAFTHEFFHLYHFNYLLNQPTLAQVRTAHIPLIVEGLAVAGAETVYPAMPPTLYLHFTDKQFESQREELAASARKFLELIKAEATPDKYEQWFTDAAPTEVPKRGGYLLGYEVVQRIMAMYTLDQIVRMPPTQLREHVEEQLAAIAAERVLLIETAN